MRGFSRNIFLLAFWLVCAQMAAAQGTQVAVARALARHPLRGARVAVLVRRLSDGKTLYRHNAEEKLEIASNVKLFATAAALWRLGPDFIFRTPVIMDGPIANGRLNGNLMVVGGGDPLLSSRFCPGNNLRAPREMAEALKAAGVMEVSGDLVLNERFFDRELYAPGWAKADRLRQYGAPASALSFNDNCLNITVTGAHRPGQAPKVKVSPDVGFARIVNNAITVAQGKRDGLAFSLGAQGEYVISGRICVGKSRGENLAVTDPPRHFAAVLRKELTRAGIKLRGQTRMIRPGETFTPEAQTVCAWESPLALAIKVANQRSRNFFAEQILKTLGASTRGAGSRENGIAEVMALLEKANVADGSVTLTDGCGLAPGNMATPEAIVQLLTFMHKSEAGALFCNSLAVNGATSGTLRNRLKEKVAAGRIHGKTGTITSRGVSALSGYARARGNELVAFCILINGVPQQNYYAAKLLENSVCRAILGVPEPIRKKRRRTR